MALATGNTASGSFGAVSSTTVGVVNNANSVVTLLVCYYSNGAFATTNNISDPSNEAWRLRSRTTFQSAYAGAGTTANANFFTVELWWSSEVTSHNRNITLNIDNSSGIIKAQWMILCVTGSTTFNAPWDTNAGLPAVQTFGNASSTHAISQSVTSSQNNSMFIGWVCEETSTTSGATLASTGSGFTAVDNQQDGTTPNFFHIFQERELVATAGTITAAATTNKQSFVFLVDALSGTSTGTANGFTQSGTITTSLTKASQSASGTTTTPPTGTISQALTKISQTVTAKEVFTGTITTNLSKMSISALAAAEIYTGTITTHLTKPSQSLSGAETFTGSITTHLSGISQHAAAADLTITGTIVTTLPGINQLVSAQEVFTGNIVTNIDGGTIAFHIDGRVFEVFTGDITTRLGPISQALVAEEDITGTITTNLGPASGHLIGTEVQALEIIEGPIVMQLGQPRFSILGAQLGTPGAGKWYSYRYLDS